MVPWWVRRRMPPPFRGVTGAIRLFAAGFRRKVKQAAPLLDRALSPEAQRREVHTEHGLVGLAADARGEEVLRGAGREGDRGGGVRDQIGVKLGVRSVSRGAGPTIDVV
jgi:hypothetical protein